VVAAPPPLPADPATPALAAPAVAPSPPPMPLPPPVRPEPLGGVAPEPRPEMFVPEKPAPTRGRKRKKAWFEEIFDEDWLRTVMPVSSGQTRREVDFLEESLQPSKESQVLDLGCGEGRHAIELASRGYQLTGFDLSLQLLIRAADEAQRRDIHVNFIHGDFRELSFEEQFDAAYCLHTSFGYFDDDANRKVVQSVNAALRVGGRFLLDVANRDFAIRDLPARIWWEGNGCVVLEEVDFNYFTSRIISKRSVVFEDGRHLEQEISVRSYSLHELGKILHHAGFRVLEVTGHYAHRTRFFGNASRSLVLLAEKRPL
jgi:SAM-dependent methyltransferase